MVTVGVCVRNSAATLREAVDSILCQDYPHEFMEVIFVDDGSEDETLSIIDSYVPRMNMKTKVFHHEWKGLGLTRNVVVDNANGDYIVWVDGDMVLPRDHVKKQVMFMERNPKVGIAKARPIMVKEESVVAVLENVPFLLHASKNVSLDSKLPGTGGSIYRVEAIRQVRGFDSEMRGVGEDQDIAYRIREAGWLLKRTHVGAYDKRAQSWNELWKKYVWYGRGNYLLHKKYRGIIRIYKMIPPAGLIAGLLCSFHAYRLTGDKLVFILPLHFIFKSTAWCWGFILGHLDMYMHR
jgi:glycosyltransferase involved in cell wall biosynthesis